MPTFDKKSLYHSDLVRQGQCLLRLKTTPMQSKFSKPGLSHWCAVQFPDDDTEYSLSIEDSTLETWKRIPKDQWVRVMATGGPDQVAKLIVADGAGPVLPADDFVPQDSEDAEPPPPLWPDEAQALPAPTSAPKSNGGTVAKAVAMTVEAVRALEAAGIRIDSDAAARVYNTHFIQANR